MSFVRWLFCLRPTHPPLQTSNYCDDSSANSWREFRPGCLERMLVSWVRPVWLHGGVGQGSFERSHFSLSLKNKTRKDSLKPLFPKDSASSWGEGLTWWHGLLSLGSGLPRQGSFSTLPPARPVPAAVSDSDWGRGKDRRGWGDVSASCCYRQHLISP